MTARQAQTPFATSLQRLSQVDWERCHVPGHRASAGASSALPQLFDPAMLAMDFPMLFSNYDLDREQLDQRDRVTPLAQATELAAEAVGAAKVWFLTNGASVGNHIAMMTARCLGEEILMQRNAHVSAIDGVIQAGLVPHFISPTISPMLGGALGITAADVRQALTDHPDTKTVYVVSPSYFGTTLDIAAIAEVCHDAGAILIVDESWGSHFGYHPQLPTNSVRLGADLVVSSTHKAAGSLTQSAMLQLGDTTWRDTLQPLVERCHRSHQSTSSSALLFASLDLARAHLATRGPELIEVSLGLVGSLREQLGDSNEIFSVIDQELLTLPGVHEVDPLKVVLALTEQGPTGHELFLELVRKHRVTPEMATHASLLFLFGATAQPNVPRLVSAIMSAAETANRDRMARMVDSDTTTVHLALPEPGPMSLKPRQAFFTPSEVVPLDEAVGRISADSLAAYPPGVPNVIPGEVFTNEIATFLHETARSPGGHVRGALDPSLSHVRVVA